MPDGFTFTRKLHGQRIAVTAEWASDVEAWAMQCRRNGELLSQTVTNDPWLEAKSIIDEELLKMEDENEG